MTKKATDITLQQEEEQVLTAAVRKAVAKVKKEASVANLKALEATKKALAEFHAAKAARNNPEERILKNLTEVAAYLSEERGFKVSERKVYDDKRLIKKQSDGTYIVRDAEEYAAQFLQKKDGSSDDNGQAAIKAQKENELLEEKIKRERRRNQIETSKLILRSKVDQQLAARAAFLISDLEAFATGKLPEIADAVLDSTETPAELAPIIIELRNKIGPELSAAFLTEMRKWLDRYAQPIQFQAPMINDYDLEDDTEEVE